MIYEIKWLAIFTKNSPMRILSTLLLFMAVAASAQQPGCDGTRYLDYVFLDYDVTTEVTFGENNTQAGFLNSLEMDIYQPTGDGLTSRPCVVLAHGGSFIAGSRQDLEALCIDFALRGYVAVTIDYRLYDVFAIPTKDVVSEIVIQAVSDMRAAIRFLREDADNGNTYGIDPDFIFAGGVSAGAITAVHTGFIDASDDLGEPMTTIVADNGGLEGNSSDNTEYSSAVQGILNYSGAIKNIDWIGANNPPIFSAHDEFDDVVPYGSTTTTALITPIFIEGSESIHSKAEDVGLWNNLITIEGSTGHVSFFSNANDPIFWEVLDESAVMMEYVYCNQITNVPTVELAELSIYPNPATDILNVYGLSEVQSIRIFNSVGQVVMTDYPNDPRATIDVSQLAAGSYVVRTTSGGNEKSTHLIIH